MKSCEYLLYVILVLMTSLISCETEEFPITSDFHSILITEDPSEINADGTTLNAKLILHPDEELVEFGFIFQSNNEQVNIRVSDWKPEEDFNYRLTSDLVVGENYEYWAYANTSRFQLTGATKSFVAGGSSLPEITDFYPKTAIISDEITVIGKNLSALDLTGIAGATSIASENITIIKADVDTLKFMLPTSLFNGIGSTLSFRSGQINLIFSNQIELRSPEIISIDKSRGFMAETKFRLIVNNLDPRKVPISIFFIDPQSNNVNSSSGQIEETSSNGIVVRSQIPGTPGQKIIRVTIGDFEMTTSSPVELIPRWDDIGRSPLRRDPKAIGVIGRKAYFVTNNSTHEFDIAENSWKSLTPPPNQAFRNLELGFSINNKIYYGSGSSDDFHQFDPVSNSWTRLQDFRRNFGSNALTGVVENKFYVLSKAEDENLIWQYTPELDAWISATFHLPSEIRNFTGLEPHFVFENKLYFVSEPEPTGTISLYKVSFNNLDISFEEVSSLSIPNFNHSTLHTFFGNVFLPDSGPVISMTVFNPLPIHETRHFDFQTEQWSLISSYLTESIGHSFRYQGAVYGLTKPNITTNSQLYKFRPSL